MTPTTRSPEKAARLDHPDVFAKRHIGPTEAEAAEMLKALGYGSLDELIDAAVPKSIRTAKPLGLPAGLNERGATAELSKIASHNLVFRSFIGAGYHDCITPPVILRNILENPGWYTAYTPYQAEIAQGRLEALLNFQTMVIDLTGLEVANASLLDEGTAAAEAMAMSYALRQNPEARVFHIASDCHPQTIEVVRTRAEPLGIKVVVGPHASFALGKDSFGVLVQYPAANGLVHDFEDLAARAHQAGALVTVAADLLALTMLKAPGEFGADIAVGNTQRFGVPLGFGGPHAAYFATRDAHKRLMPGRIVGLSKDASGKPALRLALQTREQHIRREKATSNICTAQVLLAVIASMYAAYHGPEGLKAIARRVHGLAVSLAESLKALGLRVEPGTYFDTLFVHVPPAQAKEIVLMAHTRAINLGAHLPGGLLVALDEKTTERDIAELVSLFSGGKEARYEAPSEASLAIPPALERKSPFLTHPVFSRYHSETEMLRYLNRLQSKDLSLTTSMIPLGSCTMKLNATSEMVPVTWGEFGAVHPFAPAEQAKGYAKMFEQLEAWLADITGFSAVSLQPNAGSQGEYAGLLVIRKHHLARGQGHRDVCLIPQSAHGTNPASAVMAGMRTVVVRCDEQGNIDVADLKAKAQEHAKDLSALMVTYPSTHGVFEETIKEICSIVHEAGGQVYMDGANLNAQVGLCRPGELGADVCHLNLHKTFCIPHGGGGPGMGPIGVAAHLAPYLPSHPLAKAGGAKGIGPISAAPWGSAGILPITWMYIRMMGAEGLTRATKVAILNANYIAKKLSPHYPVLYKGKHGLVAHECILDLRGLKGANVTVEDVAKRLMDYGYHAPTVSWPVTGTVMVEPTESESKAELDRFCEAMILIRDEIRLIEQGKLDRENNPLKNAPHTAEQLAGDWPHPYTRGQAAFPAPWTREHKYWPPVRRIDNPFGDRNLVCSCPPVED